MHLPVTERFSGRVDVYTRFRETYDASLILPRLHRWCGLDPAWTIADIGAGTGMLADVFLANGNPVLAVEPNAEMRAACAELHPDTPSITLLDGTAEATGIAAHSVDAVAVGRALHWFDLERSLTEFRRILKPGGWLFVLANGRANGLNDGARTPMNAAFTELLQRFAAPGETIRAGHSNYERLPLIFREGTFHHETVPGSIILDHEAFHGYARSISYAPLADNPIFPDFLRELDTLFDRFAHNDALDISTRHGITAGRW